MAKRIDYQHEHHGHVRPDPYFWMRDDERESPEVLDYLRQENEYTERELEPLASFRETLYEEIVARIPQDDASVPVKVDGWWRYTRNETGKEYDIHCRIGAGAAEPDPTQGPAAGEEVLLDENERAGGTTTTPPSVRRSASTVGRWRGAKTPSAGASIPCASVIW